MPTFNYEAMDSQGNEIKNEVEALSHEEAISKIRNLGYFPTKVREKGGRRRGGAAKDKSTTDKRPRGTNRRVKVKILTQFTDPIEPETLKDRSRTLKNLRKF